MWVYWVGPVALLYTLPFVKLIEEEGMVEEGITELAIEGVIQG